MESVVRVQRKRRPVEYVHDGKICVRMMPTTELKCHKCGKRLSGRKAPQIRDGTKPKRESSIVWKMIDGKMVPLHRCCEHYTLSPGPKGPGYCNVPRLVGRRRPRRRSSRR